MGTQSADTELQAEAVQLELLRKATVARRAAIAITLSETVAKLACRAIRRQNSNLSDQEVLLRFAAIHYGSELAGRLRIALEQRSK